MPVTEAKKTITVLYHQKDHLEVIDLHNSSVHAELLVELQSVYVFDN